MKKTKKTELIYVTAKPSKHFIEIERLIKDWEKSLSQFA